ncbi:MAG: hypothetical protein PF501_07825 [Salinisphaera sp.]|jgi:high-affinity nickel-transport protein|nr:hypothetical protein [Salinisphaera sp.]
MLPIRYRLLSLIVAVGALHIAGLALIGAAALNGKMLLGLGGLAYLLGLRHAFDIDHIAAIDNVTRKLSYDGLEPVYVGFAFSLGHSTVVFGLTLALLFTVGRVGSDMGWLGSAGGVFGGFVSAAFLTAIAAVNGALLVSLIGRVRDQRRGSVVDGPSLDSLLARRGLFSRLLGRLYTRIDASWKLYPVGLLFGLGFDTATEIAVLGMSSVAISNGVLSAWMILAFPLLFAAGMTLMDSINGLLMMRAYVWGQRDQASRLRFNIAMTGLSVGLAGLIALMQWADLGMYFLAPHSGLTHWITSVDVELWGAGVLGLFIMLWAASAQFSRRFAGSRSR